jgi:hypothetical protein
MFFWAVVQLPVDVDGEQYRRIQNDFDKQVIIPALERLRLGELEVAYNDRRVVGDWFVGHGDDVGARESTGLSGPGSGASSRRGVLDNTLFASLTPVEVPLIARDAVIDAGRLWTQISAIDTDKRRKEVRSILGIKNVEPMLLHAPGAHAAGFFSMTTLCSSHCFDTGIFQRNKLQSVSAILFPMLALVNQMIGIATSSTQSVSAVVNLFNVEKSTQFAPKIARLTSERARVVALVLPVVLLCLAESEHAGIQDTDILLLQGAMHGHLVLQVLLEGHIPLVGHQESFTRRLLERRVDARKNFDVDDGNNRLVECMRAYEEQEQRFRAAEQRLADAQLKVADAREAAAKPAPHQSLAAEFEGAAAGKRRRSQSSEVSADRSLPDGRLGTELAVAQSQELACAKDVKEARTDLVNAAGDAVAEIQSGSPPPRVLDVTLTLIRLLRWVQANVPGGVCKLPGVLGGHADDALPSYDRAYFAAHEVFRSTHVQLQLRAREIAQSLSKCVKCKQPNPALFKHKKKLLCVSCLGAEAAATCEAFTVTGVGTIANPNFESMSWVMHDSVETGHVKYAQADTGESFNLTTKTSIKNHTSGHDVSAELSNANARMEAAVAEESVQTRGRHGSESTSVWRHMWRPPRLGKCPGNLRCTVAQARSAPSPGLEVAGMFRSQLDA